MWIFSKHRSEHDQRFLMNLDQCSRINLTPLGEKFFIEVMQEQETIPVAQVASQEEANAILQQIFASLKAGEKALDLDSVRTADGKQKPDGAPTAKPEAPGSQPEASEAASKAKAEAPGEKAEKQSEGELVSVAEEPKRIET